MSDASDYHSIPEQSVSESASASHIPKPSGLKQPSGIPSLSKISRICSSHDKKPDLPTAATPKKSEYKIISYYLFIRDCTQNTIILKCVMSNYLKCKITPTNYF